MKKYKIHFSFFNLFSESQSEVVKLQNFFKGLTAIVAGSTWYASDANAALYVGIGGYIIDVVLGCFYFEQVNKQPNAPEI